MSYWRAGFWRSGFWRSDPPGAPAYCSNRIRANAAVVSIAIARAAEIVAGPLAALFAGRPDGPIVAELAERAVAADPQGGVASQAPERTVSAATPTRTIR